MVISYTLISTWHLIRHLGQMYLRNCWFPFGHMHNFTIVIDFFSPFRDHCQHLFFSSLSYSISFHVSIPLSFTLSTHNCFEEPPAGTVINSPSCGDPINKLCTLFAVPWWWWSHTRSWLTSPAPLKTQLLLCTCNHTLTKI